MSIIDISEFQILNLIGKGQNPVYRVRCKRTDQEFALKKIRRKEFQHHLVDLQEVLYLIQSDHPNIIKVLGFSMSMNKNQMETEYNLFVLMNLMNNTLADDLKQRQQDNNPYTQEELIRILWQISSALVYLQKKPKLAHRDIKPDNVLMDLAHNCFLTDFGECFWPSRFKPTATTLVGSPYYLAPELKEMYLMEGIETIQYDPWKSDLWSFGITLIDLATNSYAGKGSIESKLKKIEGVYGISWVKFIRKLLKDEPKSRMDFIEMEKCDELKVILNKFGIDKLISVSQLGDNKQDIEEVTKDFKEEIDSVSQGVYELFKKIEKKGSLTNELEKEFDEKIMEIEEMEKISRNLQEEFKI